MVALSSFVLGENRENSLAHCIVNRTSEKMLYFCLAQLSVLRFYIPKPSVGFGRGPQNRQCRQCPKVSSGSSDMSLWQTTCQDVFPLMVGSHKFGWMGSNQRNSSCSGCNWLDVCMGQNKSCNIKRHSLDLQCFIRNQFAEIHPFAPSVSLWQRANRSDTAVETSSSNFWSESWSKLSAKARICSLDSKIATITLGSAQMINIDIAEKIRLVLWKHLSCPIKVYLISLPMKEGIHTKPHGSWMNKNETMPFQVHAKLKKKRTMTSVWHTVPQWQRGLGSLNQNCKRKQQQTNPGKLKCAAVRNTSQTYQGSTPPKKANTSPVLNRCQTKS